MRWAIYCWPGLPQLWLRGLWSGLSLAIIAAAGLNAAMAASFGLSQWLTTEVRTGLWMALGVLWIASAGFSVGRVRHRSTPESADANSNAAKDEFGVALEHYLRGNYFETERVLRRLLRRNARDLEARLMLATLLRHTGRCDEAVAQLDLLGRLEGAGKWELEIQRERELMTAADATADEPAAPTPEADAEQQPAETKDAA